MAIRSFRHKGLQRFFSTGSVSGIQAKHSARIRLILGQLDEAVEPRDMNLRDCTFIRSRQTSEAGGR